MRQGAWDILITGGILLIMGLSIWAKVSGLTIPELLKSIKEMFQDTTEEVADQAMILNE